MRILVVDDHEVVRRGICSVLATEASLTFCAKQYGVGLRGMRERVRQFGGRLDVCPNGHGTRVVAVLPIPSAPMKITNRPVAPITSHLTAERGQQSQPECAEADSILFVDDRVPEFQ